MGRISMPQGRGSQLHNRREYEKIGREIPENIDQNLSAENITLVDKDIQEAYQEIFGEALREHNEKQKRADRKIENYYEHINKSKNGEKLFYEDVIQWGKKEDFENPETREKAKESLLEYAKSFEERNPNLKLIGAYLHMDEASPHLHIDYIPVAHGYSRGMKTRNSLDKAMKEMGFKPEKETRKNNATKLWKERERAVFGAICQEKGLEVEEERTARGSLSVEEYKEAKEEMFRNLEAEKKLLEEHIAKQKKALDTNAAALDHQVRQYEERKSYLEGLDEAIEPIKDHSAKIHEETIKKGFKTENKTVVEGMTVEQVQKAFSLADIGAKAMEIITRAKMKAEEIISQAKAEAEKIVSSTNGQKEALEREITSLEKKKGTLEEKLAEAQLEQIKKDRPEMFSLGKYVPKSRNEHTRNKNQNRGDR